jgi:hypothetical protein
MPAAPLYQQIVDNASAATDARVVHFAWLDTSSREVHVGAMSGLASPAVQKGYIEQILQRVGARNRVHAAILATKRGWI